MSTPRIGGDDIESETINREYETMSNITKTSHCLGLALAVGLLTPALAWGQATDLECAIPGCVGTRDIADGAVTGNKLAQGSILTGKYADGSVTGNKLANGSILTGKFADGSVTGNKIAQGSVLAGKLANGAVRTGKIFDGAVTEGKLGDGAVSFVKLEGPVQQRVEDLEQDVGDILNPPACIPQTMDGDWQSYAVHSPADINSEAAGFTSCALTIASGGATVTGSCQDEMGNFGNVITSSSFFTVADTCDVTAHLELDMLFGLIDVTDAVLDRSRNLLTGVGTSTVVGVLLTTAARR